MKKKVQLLLNQYIAHLVIIVRVIICDNLQKFATFE